MRASRGTSKRARLWRRAYEQLQRLRDERDRREAAWWLTAKDADFHTRQMWEVHVVAKLAEDTRRAVANARADSGTLKNLKES